MNKDKINKIIAEIDSSSVPIPSELFGLKDDFSYNQTIPLRKKYGNIENYLIMLYYFWFIEKKQKSEIANIFEVNPGAIQNYIYDFMWGDSQDWGTSLQHRQNKISEGLRLREIGKKINVDDYPELSEIIKNAKRYKNYVNFKGFSSEEEYLKVLAYYHNIVGLGSIQMVSIMGDNCGKIRQRLETFNLNLSHDEGIAAKKRRGSQNYTKSILNRKLTTIKSQRENFNTASKNENYARNFFAIIAYQSGYFDREQYDVIIGCSNTGILGLLEIDIPIIVINLKTQVCYKFAVEHNGIIYHTDEKDKEKETKAKERGWIYMPIYYVNKLHDYIY